MPKGDNPNSRANLKPVRSKKEARERGSKGGKSSGVTRSAMKPIKEMAMEELTEADVKGFLKALRRAMLRGYLPAIEFYLKLIGQHPDQGGGTDKSITVTIQDGLEKYAD